MYLKPAEVHHLEEKGEKFFPFDLASTVHLESAKYADRLRDNALDGEKNIIIDTVSINDRVLKTLSEKGYDVKIINTEVPEEISVQRTQERYLRGYTQALDNPSIDNLGGRFVPESAVRRHFHAAPKGYNSKPMYAAERAAEEYDNVSIYTVYDNTYSLTKIVERNRSSFGSQLSANTVNISHLSPAIQHPQYSSQGVIVDTSEKHVSYDMSITFGNMRNFSPKGRIIDTSTVEGRATPMSQPHTNLIKKDGYELD